MTDRRDIASTSGPTIVVAVPAETEPSLVAEVSATGPSCSTGFDGSPPAPEPGTPSSWDASVHARGVSVWSSDLVASVAEAST